MIKSVSATFFEVGIRHDKMMDDGSQKKVTEKYVFDAVSFSEAEEKAAKEIEKMGGGEAEVKSESQASYGEVVVSDANSDDRWYKVKVAIITVDERSGKEKRTYYKQLVQGASVSSAINNVTSIFGTTMLDYEISSVAETKIVDVILHKTEATDGV